MITVKIFFDGLANQSLKDFRSSVDADVQKECKGFASQTIKEQEENSYPIIFWQQYCADLNGYGTAAFLKAIQGKDSVYLVSKDWRGDTFQDNKKLPMAQEDVIYWTKYLSTVIACDSRAPGHECNERI